MLKKQLLPAWKINQHGRQRSEDRPSAVRLMKPSEIWLDSSFISQHRYLYRGGLAGSPIPVVSVLQAFVVIPLLYFSEQQNIFLI